jgi:hypothetical protein
MISGVIHAMIATQNKESGFKVILTLHSGVYFVDDRIHFLLLGNHVPTEAQLDNDYILREPQTIPLGTRFMTDMIKPEVMHDHHRPIVHHQLLWDMTCDIIIHFKKILK